MKQVVSMGNLGGPLPENGEYIKVSGFRDQNGDIHASRIAKAQAGAVFLSGPVSMRNGNTIMIGKMEISASQLPDTPMGARISAEGELHDGKLLARSVRTSPALPFANQAKRWLVQGFVAPDSAGKF
ncbi:MAG TPA: hypothetical protein DCX54_11740, partial [Flavobacteriales bacterium]|nr:hypothetical protein [Flavobacteriales bacterium]